MHWKKLILQHGRQLGTLAGLLLLCVALTILTPYFLTLDNLKTVLEQSAINGIIAVGMTFVIISAGIDLSVGSILAFSGIILALVLEKGMALPMALLVGLGAGGACGLVNGLLVTLGRLPPFIATLGMMSVARGGALLMTDGRPVSGFDQGFRILANGEFLFIPAPAWIMLIVYVLSHVLLTRTRFGLYTYAMGGNEQASHLSGVNIRFHKTLIYVLSGCTSAVAAIVLTARLNSAQPIAGMTYELDAIAATVIGGTSLMGGRGTLAGTLIGALLMGVLRNGLNLLGVSSFLQQIIIGAVIIAAVLFDTAFKRRNS